MKKNRGPERRESRLLSDTPLADLRDTSGKPNYGCSDLPCKKSVSLSITAKQWLENMESEDPMILEQELQTQILNTPTFWKSRTPALRARAAE
jgi:hypothetical protein